MPNKMPQPLYIPAPRLNQLRIMQQIARDAHVTQAELARHCSLSVAMVNNYMKELCASGLLEYRRKSSKTVSYHLTPAGTEATSLTSRSLVQELVALFADAKARIREIVLTGEGNGTRRVAVYGSGDFAELVVHALDSSDVNIVGVCDDDPARSERDLCGRRILKSDQMQFLSPDLVIVADPIRMEETCSSLKCLSERGIDIVHLDGSDHGSPMKKALGETAEEEARPALIDGKAG